ncbi:hypothetical protein PQX77_011339 [Marasmius sp. AFHP31]|nr:hypothetical protein PQX77_011339 [Marasmius sp. AFHP31]
MGRSNRYSIPCFYLAILFLLLSATGCICQSQPESPTPNDSDISSRITFTGDIDQWSSAIDKLAQESGIPDDKKTELAINVGLERTPEIQSVMKARHGDFTLLSGGQVWEYTAFLDDLSRVHAQAQRSKGNGEHAQDLTKPEDLVKAVEGGINDLKSLLSGIQLPQIDLEGLLRTLKPALVFLVRVFLDVTASVLDFMKTLVHAFIQAQLKNLPSEVQTAITEFRDFKEEHPYVVAAAKVAFVVVATHVILSHAFLWILKMIGFGPSGPRAGSSAAAIQSSVYSANTSGVFSVLQSAAMTPKIVWPVTVFMGITALVAGAIISWPPVSLKAV